jgi:hypothetical protein
MLSDFSRPQSPGSKVVSRGVVTQFDFIMLVPSNLSTAVRIALALFVTSAPILYYFKHAELSGVAFIPSFTPPSTPNENAVYATPNQNVTPTGGATSEKEQFIEKIMSTEIDGPFNSAPLEELCAKTVWQEGLVMSCEATRGGGMGNIRNVFIDCVRFVIEAGGTYL